LAEKPHGQSETTEEMPLVWQGNEIQLHLQGILLFEVWEVPPRHTEGDMGMFFVDWLTCNVSLVPLVGFAVVCHLEVMLWLLKINYRTPDQKIKLNLWAMDNLFPLIEFFWFLVSIVFGIFV